MSSPSMKTLLIGLTLLSTVAATGAESVCAIIPASSADSEVRAADLLALQLQTVPGIRLVERSELQQVLKEQVVANALSAESAGNRLKLGKLLKADLLIFLRERTGKADGNVEMTAIELTAAETRRGLRLVMETEIWQPARAEEICKRSFESVLRAQELAGRDDLRVLAVPPFESKDIASTYDGYRAGLARLLQETLIQNPGIVVVELAEARALAQESSISSERVARDLPYYLIGSYQTSYVAKVPQITLTLDLQQNQQSIRRIQKEGLPPKQIKTGLEEAARELFADIKLAAPTTAPSKLEAGILTDRGAVFRQLGAWEAAMSLYESALLLDDSNQRAHRGLFAAHCAYMVTGSMSPRPYRALSFDPTLRVANAELALQHFERVLAGKLDATPLAIDIVTFAAHFHLAGYDTVRDPDRVVARYGQAVVRFRVIALQCLLRPETTESLHGYDRWTLAQRLVLNCKYCEPEPDKSGAYECLYQLIESRTTGYGSLRDIVEAVTYQNRSDPPDPAYEAFLKRAEHARSERARVGAQAARIFYGIHDRSSFENASREIAVLLDSNHCDALNRQYIQGMMERYYRQVQSRHTIENSNAGTSIAKLSSLQGQLRFKSAKNAGFNIYDWCDCGGAADIVATYDGLFQLGDASEWTPIDSRQAFRLHWDGRYVWVLGKTILVCDPKAGRIAEFDEPEVLEGTSSSTGQLSALRPGAACFVGYVWGHSARSWGMLLEVGKEFPGGHRATRIFEARSQAASSSATLPDVASRPLWVTCLREAATGKDAILVGDGDGLTRILRPGSPASVVKKQWPFHSTVVPYSGGLLLGSGQANDYRDRSALYFVHDLDNPPSVLVDFGQRDSKISSWNLAPYYSDMSIHDGHLHLLADPRVGGRPAWVAVDLKTYAASLIVDALPAQMHLGEPHCLRASKRYGLVLLTQSGPYQVELPPVSTWPPLAAKSSDAPATRPALVSSQSKLQAPTKPFGAPVATRDPPFGAQPPASAPVLRHSGSRNEDNSADAGNRSVFQMAAGAVQAQTLHINMEYIGEKYSGSISSIEAKWVEEKPPEVRTAPARNDAQRYWGKIALGERGHENTLWFIVDDRQPGPLFRWYQPSVGAEFTRAENVGTNGMANELILELEYKQKGDTLKLPYRLWFFINEGGYQNHVAQYYAKCYRSGRIAMSAQKYAITVVDSPPNGDYSDDAVYIDVNRDNRLDEKSEAFHPGDTIHLGGRTDATDWILQSIPPSGLEVVLVRKQ